MKRAFFLLLALGSTVVTAANCGGTSSLVGRPCPCSDGYVCCEATSVCLAPGEKCSATPPPPLADASPDTADGSLVNPPQCGAEPKEPPAGDAGPVVDAGPDGGGVCPTTDPITAAGIDAQLAWTAPAAPQNVCTQQNIDALKAIFKSASGGVKFSDIKIALGATCASCAFSPLGAPNLQVFGELGGGAIDNRVGSCFAQRVGGACGPRYGAVCGRARYRFEACLELACSVDDCGGDAAYQACKVKAQKGACKAVSGAYTAACPNEVDLLPLCENVFQAIATSCSGGSTNTINTTP